MFFGTFMFPFASLSQLEHTDWWCHFSFILDQFFGTATVLWYTMVALNTWLAIRGVSADSLLTIRKYQHLFCWGYSLGITVPPLVMQNYGPMVQSYCWFENASDPWRLTFYLPIILSLFFCLFLLCYTLVAYWRRWHVFKARNIAAAVVILRIFFIVFVYVVFWSVALVGRIQNYFIGQDYFQYHVISLTSSGICNFVVWGITSPRIVQLWGSCMNCCKPQRQSKKSNPPAVLPPNMMASDIDIDERHDADMGEGGEVVTDDTGY